MPDRNEVSQVCHYGTYVAMQHFNDTVPVSQLGASPAELAWLDLNPPGWEDPTMIPQALLESFEGQSWHCHDGEAELRLHDTVFDGGE